MKRNLAYFCYRGTIFRAVLWGPLFGLLMAPSSGYATRQRLAAEARLRSGLWRASLAERAEQGSRDARWQGGPLSRQGMKKSLGARSASFERECSATRSPRTDVRPQRIVGSE